MIFIAEKEGNFPAVCLAGTWEAPAPRVPVSAQGWPGRRNLGFLTWVPLVSTRNSASCWDFIKSVRSDMEISSCFFPEQLALVLEELEGKEGDGMAEEKAVGVRGTGIYDVREAGKKKAGRHMWANHIFRCEWRCMVSLWDYSELQRAVAHPVIEGT